MRKLGLILLLAIISNISFAQDMKFGLTVTPHFNWYNPNNEDINQSVRAGFKYGGIGEFYFAENYAFTIGVNHVLSGGSFSHDSSGYIFFEQGELANNEIDTIPQFTDYKMNLQYIEIPITLKLKTNEIGYITYYGQIGVTPGIKLKGRVNASSENSNEDLENTDVLRDISFFNLALTIGGGIEYSLTEDVSLLAGLYFNNGFTDVIPKDGGNDSKAIKKIANGENASRVKSSDGEKITNKNIGLRLGFMF